MDNHELRELYAWGILSYEVFSRYAMSNASLPVEDRNKNPPDHPLGLGYENDTKPKETSETPKKKPETPKKTPEKPETPGKKRKATTAATSAASAKTVKKGKSI